MEKMNVKAQAEVRANMYEMFKNAVESAGYATEPFSEGILIHLGEGQFAKVNVSVANPEKFDLEATRKAYAEKLAAAAERAEKARAKAEEKERKAKEKAEKAAEKANA